MAPSAMTPSPEALALRSRLAALAEHVSAAKDPRELRRILLPSAPTTASRGAPVAGDAIAADAAIA
jgi:hypothetical protein